MKRNVLVERGAKDSLARLPPQTKRRLKAAISLLAEAPDTSDHGAAVKRLDVPESGEPVYRLRVGKYRVVFVVRAREVRVLRVFHRDEGYDWLGRLGLD